MRATWSDGLYKEAHTCGVGRQGLSDPRVFGQRDWGTTRLGCEVKRVDLMATSVDEDELGARHARRGWKGRSEVNVTDSGRGRRHVVEQCTHTDKDTHCMKLGGVSSSEICDMQSEPHR